MIRGRFMRDSCVTHACFVSEFCPDTLNVWSIPRRTITHKSNMCVICAWLCVIDLTAPLHITHFLCKPFYNRTKAFLSENIYVCKSIIYFHAFCRKVITTAHISMLGNKLIVFHVHLPSFNIIIFVNQNYTVTIFSTQLFIHVSIECKHHFALCDDI